MTKSDESHDIGPGSCILYTTSALCPLVKLSLYFLGGAAATALLWLSAPLYIACERSSLSFPKVTAVVVRVPSVSSLDHPSKSAQQTCA